MTSPTPSGPTDPEDRRKHLDHVQAVIARLAGASATAKGWSLTIATAAFGFSTLADKWYLVLLGLAVIVSFSILDAYYLREERLFRCLHEAVVAGTVAAFSMNKDQFKTQATRRRTYFSWSVLGFYVPLAVAGVLVAGIAYQNDPSGKAKDGKAKPRAVSVGSPSHQPPL